MSEKTNFEVSVEQALGLPESSPPMVQKTQPVEVVHAESTETNIDDDFATARRNLHKIIHQGNDALEEALLVAKTSEHPRAFEVVGGLMKQLADINQQLMDIHQQKKKLEEPTKGTASKEVTTNNAIFVGSTAELSKMLSNMNKGE